MSDSTQVPQSYEELKTDAEQLGHMLEETTSNRALWSEADYGPILRHQLATRADAQLVGRGKAVPAGTFAELLRDPNPDPDVLRSLKDFAKNLRTEEGSGFPAAVATILYYAGLVAAQRRAGVRISELDDERLKEGCTWALAQSWITDDLRTLFSEGCRE